MIALHAAVHDGAVALLSDALLHDRRISPVWEAPVLWRDLAPFHYRLCVIANSLLESRVEVAVVQEDIGVVIPPVEMSLKRLDGLNHAVKLLVSGEDHNCRIRARAFCVRFEAAYCERLVVLLTDFPVSRQSPAMSWSYCQVAYRI
jgi:hypothetical protein